MTRTLMPLLLLALPFTTNAQTYKPIEAQYRLYSGSIGDPMPAGQDDTKLSLVITGEAAEAIFRQIGPDLEDQCGAEDGSRFRARGDGSVACQYSLKDGYLCYLGIDLLKGKPVSASVC